MFCVHRIEHIYALCGKIKDFLTFKQLSYVHIVSARLLTFQYKERMARTVLILLRKPWSVIGRLIMAVRVQIAACTELLKLVKFHPNLFHNNAGIVSMKFMHSGNILRNKQCIQPISVFPVSQHGLIGGTMVIFHMARG
jgi:hypothetical protein